MSSIQANNSNMSLYPHEYGSNQTTYLKKSEEAVQNGVKSVREALDGKKDLQKLFFSLLDSFAKTSHELASSLRINDARTFGYKRLDDKSDVRYTVLSKGYEVYNSKIIKFMQKILKGSIPLKEDPSQKTFIKEEQCLGRKCSFEINLITQKDLLEKQWDKLDHPQAAEVKKQSTYVDKKVNENHFPPKEEDQIAINEFNQLMLSIKNDHPEVYQHAKMSFLLRAITNKFPALEIRLVKGKTTTIEHPMNRMNIFIMGTTKIEINNKMHTLSEMITWTYQTHESDSVERMKHSTVFIIHQDRFLIEETLKEVAPLFEKALMWDKKVAPLKVLKGQVALIRYLFSHAMRYLKGSESIGEWLEKVIYSTHGFTCHPVTNTSADMEAFVAPLWSKFRNDIYDTTIELSSPSVGEELGTRMPIF
jgi:hypothetical protein